MAENIDDYIASAGDARRDRLQAIIGLVRRLYPDAVVSMKYRMPTFETAGGWVAVANQKHYLSLYTCSAEHLDAFKRLHPDIKTGKGCINLRDRDHLPLDDLATVVRSAMGHHD